MISLYYRMFLVWSLILISALTCFGQHKSYTTSRISGEAPEIDGEITEPAWDIVQWEGGFIQYEPANGKPPTELSEFKIVFDDEALYVAIRGYDSNPDLIDRRMTRRDQMEGDFMGIHIDSYFDRRTAFSFMVNAAGVKSDYLISNDYNEDYSWDPVWYVKTSVDSLGWIAEMKIPLTQIRFANVESHTWGIEVGRYLFRLEEVTLWNPIPKQNSVWVSEFGNLEGIRGIRPKKEVELLPYVMGKVDLYDKEEGNPYADGTDWGYNAGLDGKVAITNDLTMNFTINPDFGQVEADPSVVNLTAFETFYSEKRPFFVEGGNIYNFKLTGGDGPQSLDNLFYSRRIGRIPHHEPETQDGEYVRMPDNTTILGALKVSGKTRNGWSVGIMESVTQKEVARIDSEGQERKETVEPLTNYYNTRLQKDFKQGKTIVGGMFTATNRFINDTTVDFLTDAAYTGGADFVNYWKDRTYYLRLKGAFSYLSGSKEAIREVQECTVHNFQRSGASHLTLDTNRTSLAGHGGIVEFGKQGGGNWKYVFWLTWRSPGFELNDMGYLRQADIIQQVIWGGYQILQPVGIFREFYLNLNQYSGWDFGGNYIYNGANASINTKFKNYWGFNTGLNYDFTSLDRYELRGGPAIKNPGALNIWAEINSDSRKKLNAEIGSFARWGQDEYDRHAEFWLGLTYRPVNALQISLSPQYSWRKYQLQYVETVDFNGNEQYIMGRIRHEMIAANIRINLSITPDLSIQYWGQPFVFAGDYGEYKKAAETMSDDYYRRFHVFTDQEITFSENEDLYYVDDDHDGMSDYSFENPDFSFFEFRSNLVLRWEYIPGSVVYFVWSQNMAGDNNKGRFDFPEVYGDLFSQPSSNIFLVKFSYRISL